MRTVTEVLNFLVSKGVPQNLAKASIHEAYRQHAPADANPEDIYGYGPGCTEPELVEMGSTAVWMMHEIVGDSLSYVKGGIAVFGDLKYDMNGDLL